MDKNLYGLYQSHYGDSSLSELDFTTEINKEDNQEFIDSFKEKLLNSGMQSEEVDSQFTTGEENLEVPVDIPKEIPPEKPLETEQTPEEIENLDAPTITDKEDIAPTIEESPIYKKYPNQIANGIVTSMKAYDSKFPYSEEQLTEGLVHDDFVDNLKIEMKSRGVSDKKIERLLSSKNAEKKARFEEYYQVPAKNIKETEIDKWVLAGDAMLESSKEYLNGDNTLMQASEKMDKIKEFHRQHALDPESAAEYYAAEIRPNPSYSAVAKYRLSSIIADKFKDEIDSQFALPGEEHRLAGALKAALRDKRLNEPEFREYVQALIPNIDSTLNGLEKTISALTGDVDKVITPSLYGGVAVAQIATNNKLISQRILRDTKRVVEQFKNDEFLKDLGKGFAHGEIPIISITDGMAIMNVVKKEKDDEELSPDEKNLLKVYAFSEVVNAEFPRSIAFNVGEGIGTNIEFMAELALAAGATAAIKSGVKKAVKKGLESEVKFAAGNWLKKITRKWLPEVSGMVAANLALVPALPMTFREYQRERIGEVSLKGDIEDLEVDVSKALKRGKGESGLRAGFRTFTELISESSGEYLDLGIKSIAKRRLIRNPRVGSFGSKLKLATRFNGPLEIVEEYIAQVLQYPLDKEFDLSAKTFAEISLSVMAISGPMYLANRVSTRKTRADISKAKKNLDFLSKEDMQELNNSLLEPILQGRSDKVAEFMAKDYLTPEQRRKVIEYATLRTVSDGMQGFATDEELKDDEGIKQKEFAEKSQRQTEKAFSEKLDKKIGTLKEITDKTDEDIRDSLESVNKIIEGEGDVLPLEGAALSTALFRKERLENVFKQRLQVRARKAQAVAGTFFTEKGKQQPRTLTVKEDILTSRRFTSEAEGLLQKAEAIEVPEITSKQRKSLSKEQLIAKETQLEALRLEKSELERQSQEKTKLAAKAISPDIFDIKKGSEIEGHLITSEDVNERVLFSRSPQSLDIPVTIKSIGEDGKILLTTEAGTEMVYVPSNKNHELFKIDSFEQREATEEFPLTAQATINKRLEGLDEANGKFTFRKENESDFDLYNRFVKRWTKGRKRIFDTEKLANEYFIDVSKNWGSLISTPGFAKNIKGGKWVVHHKVVKLESGKQLAERKESQRLQSVTEELDRYEQDINNALSTSLQEDLLSRRQLESQGDGVSASIILFEQREVIENPESTEDEITSAKRKAEVVASTKALYSNTGAKIRFVESDPLDRFGYVNGKDYVVNLEKATPDTPVHEFMHPIVDLLFKESPALANNLWNDLKATEEGTIIIDSVNKRYPEYSANQKRDEAIVEALGKKGWDTLKNDVSDFSKAVRKIWYSIRDFFNNAFGINIVTTDITLDDLAKLIVTGRLSETTFVKGLEQRGISDSENLSKTNNPSGGNIAFIKAYNDAVVAFPVTETTEEKSNRKLLNKTKIDVSVDTAIELFKEGDFYKNLPSNKKRIWEQNTSTMLHKMIKKQKDIITEEGVNMTVLGMDNIGSTADAKMQQFRSGFTSLIRKISDETGLQNVDVEISLIELFKGNEFDRSDDIYTSDISPAKEGINSEIIQIAKDSMTKKEFRSLVNFYGSLHLEGQEGLKIDFKNGTAEFYSQVNPLTTEDLIGQYNQHLAQMNTSITKIITDKINKFKLDSQSLAIRNTTNNKSGLVTSELLSKTEIILSDITGLSKEATSAYLSDSKSFKKGNYEFVDGKYIPVDSGFSYYDLIGKQIYFKNRDGNFKPIQNTAIMQSFLVAFDSAKLKPNFSLSDTIRKYFDFRFKGTSNIDNIALSFARVGKPGIRGVNVEGKAFSSMTLAHQISDIASEMENYVTDPIQKDYYKNNPTVLVKFDGIFNQNTEDTSSGASLTMDEIWLTMALQFNKGKDDYQQLMGQFSDKKTVYTLNAPKYKLNRENALKAQKIVPNIENEFSRISDIVSKYPSLFGMDVKDLESINNFAKEFTINFVLNIDGFNKAFNGDFDQYKDFTDMVKRSQVSVSPGYKLKVNIDNGVKNDINIVYANDLIAPGLDGIDGIDERFDGLTLVSDNFSKEITESVGDVFARREEFDQVDTIKGVFTSVDENGQRLLIKSNILNVNVLADTFDKNHMWRQLQTYMNENQIDILTFPSSAKKFNKSLESEINWDDIPNSTIPISSIISKNDLYIQQDLRHTNEIEPHYIPSQLYGNIMTLGDFREIAELLSDISTGNVEFINQVFSGFKDLNGVKDYLLKNTNRNEDPDFHALVQNWSINDPDFQNKAISKLINLVNRDILEINVPRQSTTEIPDIDEDLLELRKSDDGIHSLLPEIGVNIPNIRYARTYETKEAAELYVQKNLGSLPDLRNEDGSFQDWQLYNDVNGLWVVPGEPVLSTRVPADDLHSHTVARAKLKINRGSFTMLDADSQVRSGSDFDGDARYNWILYHDPKQKVFLRDDSPMGITNKVLMKLVANYQDVKNFDKITQPIDTNAYDSIISGIMSSYKEDENINLENPASPAAIESARQKNMTGFTMKGIVSNLTTVFSYLKSYDAALVVKDEFNMVKAHLGNLLNLSFDNAKDPRIEQLGFNEITAPMFVYDLMTNKDIDKAKSRTEANDIVVKAIGSLAKKYSPFSTTQNEAISIYLTKKRASAGAITPETESNIIKDVKGSIQLTFNNLYYQSFGRDKGKSHYSKLWNQYYNKEFGNSYKGGQDLNAFKKIQGVRDGISNRLDEHESVRDAFIDFIYPQGNRFYDKDKIYYRISENKAMLPSINAMKIANNIFNLVPNRDIYSWLQQRVTNSYNMMREFDVNSATRSMSDKHSLLSYSKMEYLTKIRHASFRQTAETLKTTINGYNKVQLSLDKAETELKRNEIISLYPGKEWATEKNSFLDLLSVENEIVNNVNFIKIGIASYYRFTEMTEDQIAKAMEDFSKLPIKMQDMFVYYTMLQYGFSTSLRAGGFYGLVDTETRARIANIKLSEIGQVARLSKYYKQAFSDMRRIGIERAENFDTPILDVRRMMRFDASMQEAPVGEIPTAKELIDFIDDVPESKDVSEWVDDLALKLTNGDINKLKEFIEKFINGKSSENIHHQDKGISEGEYLLLENPEFFSYMYEQFKDVYPELEVFNDSEKFLEYIVKNNGRIDDFDLLSIGAAFSGAVLLTDRALQDTFFHEVSHLYWDAMNENDKTKNDLRALYGWNSSMSEQETKDIDELVIEDIGISGTDMTLLRFDGNRRSLFLNRLRKFWEQVKSIFSLSPKSRAEARMKYLRFEMVDRIWNNRDDLKNQSKEINHQHKATGNYTDFEEKNTTVEGVTYTTPSTYLENIVEQPYDEIGYARMALRKVQSGIAAIEVGGLEFVEDVRVEDGKVFFKDQEGEEKVLGSLGKIDEEKFINEFLSKQKRAQIQGNVIHNMIEWSEDGVGLQDGITLDEAEIIRLEDMVLDPVAISDKLDDALDLIKKKFGFLETESETSLIRKDSRHHGRADMIGFDGNMSTVIEFKVSRGKVRDGNNFSPGYTMSQGYFRNSSPINTWKASKQNKHLAQLIQYANMYEDMQDKSETDKNPARKVGRLVVVPINVIENNKGQITDIIIEDELSYDFSDNYREVGNQIMTHISDTKLFSNNFYTTENQKERYSDPQEKDAVLQTNQAIEGLKLMLGVSSPEQISTHAVLSGAKLGYADWIQGASELGWDFIDFTIGEDDNISDEKFSINNFFHGKEGEGLIVYASPGVGKTLSARYHNDVVDSDVELADILHGNDQSKGVLNNPDNPLFAGASNEEIEAGDYTNTWINKMTGGTFQKEIGGYKARNITDNLLAFRLSRIIHLQQQNAIYVLKNNNGWSELQSDNINQSRIEITESERVPNESEKYWITVLRQLTPYESLNNQMQQLKGQGKVVLTSTIMKKENEYLWRQDFDRVVRLVDSGFENKETRDNNKTAGFRKIQERISQSDRSNSVGLSELDWGEKRYYRENELFGEREDVKYTSDYLTDLLFNEEFHTKKSIINQLHDLFVINQLDINKNEYLKFAKENPSSTVQDFFRKKESFFYKEDESGIPSPSRREMKVIADVKDDESILEMFGIVPDIKDADSDVLRIFRANRKKAIELWQEVSTVDNFNKRTDESNIYETQAAEAQMRYLLDLYKRVMALDEVNQKGLRSLIEGQIVSKRIVYNVAEENKEQLRYRPFTNMLYKILKDNTFSWVKDTDLNLYSSTLSKLKLRESIINRMNILFRLDRAVDKREVLIQGLVKETTDAQYKIMTESKAVSDILNTLYSKMSDSDKNNIVYLYGTFKDHDFLKAMHGRYAYIPQDRIDNAVTKGTIGEEAKAYLEMLYATMMKYDYRFNQQQSIYENKAPLFVPDIMAQADYTKREDEFNEAVNLYYGIKIDNLRDFRFKKRLYAAVKTTPEDTLIFENSEGAYPEYFGRSVAEIRRMIFDEENVTNMAELARGKTEDASNEIEDEATTLTLFGKENEAKQAKNRTSNIRGVLEDQIVTFNRIFEQSKNEGRKKYVKKTRQYKTQGAFKNSMLFRTKRHHDASKLFINSLISNHYTSQIHPFANFVERTYGRRSSTENPKNNYALNYVRQFINERLFKHRPEDLEQFSKWYRESTTLMSLAALGWNVKGQIGNFSIGQVQNMLVLPNEYKKGLSRIGQWKKGKNIMLRHNIGTIMENIRFTQGEVLKDQMINAGFFLTEFVEGWNQGIPFLGALTDEELNRFNDNGTLKEGAAPLTTNRIKSIEAAIRKAHGDFGFNRPLYSTSVVGMELTRFVFGWLQTNLHDHFGQEYLNVYGQANRSMLSSLVRGMQRMTMNVLSFVAPHKRRQIIANAFASGDIENFESHLKDTPEESELYVLKKHGMDTVNTYLKTVKIKWKKNGVVSDKFVTYSMEDEYSFWAKITLEAFQDKDSRDFSTASDLDKKNMRRLAKELMFMAVFYSMTQAINVIMNMAASGLLDDDSDDEITTEELVDAFIQGYQYTQLRAFLHGDEKIPFPKALRTYEITDAEYEWMIGARMMHTVTGGLFGDVAVPYDTELVKNRLSIDRVPIVSWGWNFIKALIETPGWIVGNPSARFEKINLGQSILPGDVKALYHLRQLLPFRFVWNSISQSRKLASGQFRDAELMLVAKSKAIEVLSKNKKLAPEEGKEMSEEQKEKLLEYIIKFKNLEVKKERKAHIKKRRRGLTEKILDAPTRRRRNVLKNNISVKDILDFRKRAEKSEDKE